MRKTIIILIALLIAGSAIAGSNLARSHLRGTVQKPMAIDISNLSAKLTALYGADAGASYLGAEVCIACHQDKAEWKHTRHDQMIRRPMAKWTLVPGKGVIANQAKAAVDDFMAGLDLGTLDAFKVYGANAPKLSYDAATDGYFMSIGALKCQLFFTLAGSEGQAQRYIMKVSVTDTASGYTLDGYFGPIQYTPGTGWSPYSATAWYDASNNPKIVPGMTASQIAKAGISNHASGCIGCHATGIRGLAKNAAGETFFKGYVAILYRSDDPAYFDYNGDGDFEILNIQCEACHGPGAQHVLGQGDPTKIVNPAALPGQQSVEICGRCHIRGKSLPAGTYNWPYHDDTDTNWIPAVPPAPWIPLATFQNSASGVLTYWADGKLPKNPRPYDQYVLSAHYSTKFGQNGSSEACGGSCHDMHMETSNPAQINEEITDARSGLVIPTSVDNDTFCLACHATHGPFTSITKQQVAEYDKNVTAIGAVVAAHANHPYGPDRAMGLGNCVDCHMSASAGHTWWVTKPEDTLKYFDKGYPNACAESCHNTYVNIFGLGLNPTPGIWTMDYDKSLASVLVKYYGPGGTWWNTTPPAAK
jgi:hypothetical protein